MRRLTQAEVIAEFRVVHGDEYDYSKVEYLNNRTKVVIVCNVHGEFLQTPKRHKVGDGCPRCGREKANKNSTKSQSTILKEFAQVHGDRYDYSKVEYKGAHEKVCIICSKHGEFWQTANEHRRGKGCERCSYELRGEQKRDTLETFVEKANKTHNKKFDYSKVVYTTSQEKVCIVCPEHGEFWQAPAAHIDGYGCPVCANNIRLTTEEAIRRFKEVHDDRYDYSKVEYKNKDTKVTIICPIHGEFEQTPGNHVQGQNCLKCYRENRLDTTEEFIEKANLLHNGLYDYDKVNYIGSLDRVTITCKEHGDFDQIPHNHLQGAGCPTCANNRNIVSSKAEKEIYKFIRRISKDAIQNDRKILNGKEIDVYVPSKKIGFEYHGLYWHQEKFSGKDSHLEKLLLSIKEGVDLIQIFEDEWLFKEEIVKSIIRGKLNKTKTKIYGRDTDVREVSSRDAKKFLDANHIQGSSTSKIRIGLYYNEELVSLMTFGGYRINMGRKTVEGEYEMLRFCNKLNTSIVGGASKLFKYFLTKYKPKKVISYSDKRYFDGSVYKTLGFRKIRDTEPNYFYVVNGRRENRFKYRKSELVKQGFDSNMTEREIMNSLGYYRIYDCGNLLFEWTNK